MSTEKIILFDSPEAAHLETRTITGWVSSRGDFHKHEREARYVGCTHKKCPGCGSIVDKNIGCRQCHEEKLKKDFQSLPREPWNGKTQPESSRFEVPLYSDAQDKYLFDIDDVRCALADANGVIADLRLHICKPNMASEIEPYDHYEDDIPEDHDPDDLPDEIIEAFEELNRKIRACKTPLSWSPDNRVPTDESVLAAIQPYGEDQA